MKKRKTYKKNKIYINLFWIVTWIMYSLKIKKNKRSSNLEIMLLSIWSLTKENVEQNKIQKDLLMENISSLPLIWEMRDLLFKFSKDSLKVSNMKTEKN